MALSCLDYNINRDLCHKFKRSYIMALFGPDNLKGAGTHGNGLGPRTVVVQIAKTNITQAEMDTMLEALASGGTYSVSYTHLTLPTICSV